MQHEKITAQKRAYRKSGTRDQGRLQPGPRDPKMSRWDPGLGPGAPKYLSGTREFQFSIVSIVYSTLYTSLVTKLCINLFIRLTYFMANIQMQPLRCGVNFKELQVVT